MKYLEEKELLEWTRRLTDFPVGRSRSGGFSTVSCAFPPESRALSVHLDDHSVSPVLSFVNSGSSVTDKADLHPIPPPQLSVSQIAPIPVVSNDAVGSINAHLIHGRLECYSMKRAGNDKKYAKELGEVLIREMEATENDLWQQEKQQKQERVASFSLSEQDDARHDPRNRGDLASQWISSAFPQGVEGAEESGIQSEDQRQLPRKRSQSVSVCQSTTDLSDHAVGEFVSARPIKRRSVSTGTYEESTTVVMPGCETSGPTGDVIADNKWLQHRFSQPTALGDFTAFSTRKLITNLILVCTTGGPIGRGP
jgi:hypothetical protein